jgi:hypothetical protein
MWVARRPTLTQSHARFERAYPARHPPRFTYSVCTPFAQRHAALRSASTSLSQLSSGFELAQIWSTISKSLILHG